MDEEETKTCTNCKREIPAVNFTMHTVHCARNIRVCPACKEPVPHAELDDHHEKLHKLLPCKQCGEMVCGSDLEDHLRDSCGHTIKSCRYCELELPRRKLPAHENYCGVRTEQCADCQEWVMIKYRRLHIDSNHGFLRLDDDPVPQPKKEPPKPTIPKTNNVPKPTNIPLPSTSNGVIKNTNQERNFNSSNQDINPPHTRNYNSSIYNGAASSSSSNNEEGSVAGSRQSFVNGGNMPKAPLKRTNDQPQINTSAPVVNKVNKDLPVSRGAVKKRPAPKPPVRQPPADPRRDLAFHSALQRHQQEERDRQLQSAYNMSVGLPPVLSAAAKLEKLRKMDALHNREVEDTDYKNKLRGRVWMPPDIPIGNVLGSNNQDGNSNQNLEASRRRIQPNPTIQDDLTHDFSNLQPMSPQEFMDRFNELRLRKGREDGGEGGEQRGSGRGDRFSEIKSSLRELRRGLNEVTAPYNSNNSNNCNQNDSSERWSRRRSPPAGAGGAVQLPCEFCGAPVPEDELVLHQVRSTSRCTFSGATVYSDSSERWSRRRSPPAGAGGAVQLPCEFCGAPVPEDELVLHQVRSTSRCTFSGATVYSDSSERWSRRRSPPAGAGGAVQLPCEFCGAPVPEDELVLHQVRSTSRCTFSGATVYSDSSERWSRRRSPPAGAGGAVQLPCEFCGAPVPEDELVLHQVRSTSRCTFSGATVYSDSSERWSRRRSPPAGAGGAVQLPCEFCGAPVPEDELVLHQVRSTSRCTFSGATVYSDSSERWSRRRSPPAGAGGAVQLPCEFCGAPVPEDELVLHQVRSTSRCTFSGATVYSDSSERWSRRRSPPAGAGGAVQLPCEFCGAPVPEDELVLHQVRSTSRCTFSGATVYSDSSERWSRRRYPPAGAGGAVQLPCEFCGAPVPEDELVLHQVRSTSRCTFSGATVYSDSSERWSRRRSPPAGAGGAVQLPCEFCGAPVPEDELVLHQVRSTSRCTFSGATVYSDSSERWSRRRSPPAGAGGAVQLPCEFCGAPVPEDELVLHQVRSTSRCTFSGATVYSDSSERWSRRRSPPAGAGGAVQLPCEFCGAPVPEDELVLHQVRSTSRCTFSGATVYSDSSERWSRRRSPPAGAGGAVQLPCEFCGAPVPEDELVLHQVRSTSRCTFSGATVYSDSSERWSRRRSPPAGAGGAVQLPCEFCGAPVPEDELVLHQTGCRPDLAQYRAGGAPRDASPPPRRASPPRDEPVIPCEFCTESLPVYLISEHQERCGRETNLLYPD